jgi:hypothetical protein
MYFNDVCATYLATIWSHWEGEDVKVAASSGILETGVVNEGVPGVRVFFGVLCFGFLAGYRSSSWSSGKLWQRMFILG